MNSVGQYTMVSRDESVKFGDRSFRVVLYGAYNAMGLIGTEHNGIAVLDEDRMQVVLDGHYPEESGAFGATEAQACEWRRICRLSSEEFVEFCNSHYNEPAKREFLRMGKQMAIRLAAALGLNEDQYEVRVNKGGIAVSGEVTLHTDTHYVQFGQFPGGRGFLVRACKGRKDYTGGRNHYVKWENLRNLEGVAEFILSLS